MLWHVNYTDKLFTRSVKLVVYEAHFSPYYRCLYSNKHTWGGVVEVPITTRFEMFINAQTLHITKVSRDMYTDSFGNNHLNYGFVLGNDDLSNLFTTILDETTIIGYAVLNKKEATLRIGYKWKTTRNSSEWDTIKLSKEVFTYVILCPDPRYNPECSSVDETLIFKYEFSEKYKYNCLYYDFSYATDTCVGKIIFSYYLPNIRVKLR